MLLLLTDEDRDMGVVKDIVADTAEDGSPDSAETSRADDDEIDGVLFG